MAVQVTALMSRARYRHAYKGRRARDPPGPEASYVGSGSRTRRGLGTVWKSATQKSPVFIIVQRPGLSRASPEMTGSRAAALDERGRRPKPRPRGVR